MLNFKVLMGCDPEFSFHNSHGKRIPANHFFGINSGDRTAMRSAIGHDGHRETAEIRPKACFSATSILLEIKRIILESVVLSKELERTQWLAKPVVEGNRGEEFQGGHVHFSFWSFLSDLQIYRPIILNNLRCNRCGESIVASIISALDNSINMPLITIALGSSLAKMTENEARVINTPERYRTQDSYSHFEWRTPQTWLVHPKLAFVFLALAKSFIRTNLEKEIKDSAGDLSCNKWVKPIKCDHIKISSGNFLETIGKHLGDYYFPQIYVEKVRRALNFQGEEVHLPGAILKLRELNLPDLSDRDFKWNWITLAEVKRVRKEFNIEV